MQSQSLESAAYSGANQTLYEGHISGVSWAAIVAGAAAAAALSLILLMLGVGLGLSSISPWSYNAGVMGTSTIAWLAFTQLAASSIGGYLAGRLRVRWASVHNDEVYFRDTAHGLLAWAVASIATVTLLTGSVHAILTDAADASAGAGKIAISAVATTGAASDKAADAGKESIDYFSDRLLRIEQLRTEQAPADVNSGEVRAEVSKIFIVALQGGTLASEDRDYLAILVAQRTGLASAEAQQRVDEVYARAAKARNDAIAAAKEAAEKARKVAAHSALWMFVALLLGAFTASLSATFGGRLRDRAHLVVTTH